MPVITRSKIEVIRMDARFKMPLYLVRVPPVFVMLIHSQRRERKKIVAGCLADLMDSD